MQHVCLDIWIYIWVHIFLYVYISMYISTYVYAHRCTAVCMYVSVCMDIGPYRHRAIWGESTVLWGFFPGEGRSKLDDPPPHPPAQSLLFWGW